MNGLGICEEAVPSLTPRLTQPRIIETDHRSVPRKVAAETADALLNGEEAIVLGHMDGVRTMVCRLLPQQGGVFLITPSPKGTGHRPPVGITMAEVARLVAAEYDQHG